MPPLAENHFYFLIWLNWPLSFFFSTYNGCQTEKHPWDVPSLVYLKAWPWRAFTQSVNLSGINLDLMSNPETPEQNETSAVQDK